MKVGEVFGIGVRNREKAPYAKCAKDAKGVKAENIAARYGSGIGLARRTWFP
ncbi:MAG: hypothetical protein KGR98_01370 [Verrucomicrobia bacterium]|nr:hypothetical protein [Verrucomicrobiota bacterium]